MKSNLKEQINRSLELMDVSVILENEFSPTLDTLLSDTTISTNGSTVSIEYGGNRQCFKLWVSQGVGVMDVNYAAKKDNGVWDIDFCIPRGYGNVVNAAMGLIERSLPDGVTADHVSNGCEKEGWMNDEDMLDLIIDPIEMGWDAKEFEEFLQGKRTLDFNSDDAKLMGYTC